MISTRVIACEAQPVVVQGLVRVLEGVSDLVLVGVGADVETALEHAPADVFLIGQPPAMKSPLPLLVRAKEAGTSAQIVLWVAELSEMDTFRALQMGARGIVTRTQSVEGLCDCLRSVKDGTVWLDNSVRAVYSPATRRQSGARITPREREIIEFVCRGMKNREIADALAITPGTVKVHLMHIFEKTGVKDRFQLALQGAQILQNRGETVELEA